MFAINGSRKYNLMPIAYSKLGAIKVIYTGFKYDEKLDVKQAEFATWKVLKLFQKDNGSAFFVGIA